MASKFKTTHVGGITFSLMPHQSSSLHPYDKGTCRGQAATTKKTKNMVPHCCILELYLGAMWFVLEMSTMVIGFSAPKPMSPTVLVLRVRALLSTRRPTRAIDQEVTTLRVSATNNDLFNDDSKAIPMDTPARQSLPSHLEFQAIPGKGLGVVTKVVIPSNTVVGDYKGEIMTTDVKDRRYLSSHAQYMQLPEDLAWAQSRRDRGQGLTGSYLYGVTMPTVSTSTSTSVASADPIYICAEDEYESLWTRFLNHASPAAGGNNLSPRSIHESWDGNPRVWFVSNRDIQVGEELCFNYGEDYWLPGDEVVH